MVQPFSHCMYCGHPFEHNAGWPRTCANCHKMSFRNPIPVCVVLLPVNGGLLAVRRAIPPQIGELALPGGYINYGESWQTAGARELFEETGLRIDPDTITEFRVRSARDGSLIVFGIAPPYQQDLPAFTPNEEASERAILTGTEHLAFGLHQEMMRLFFNLP